MLNLIGKLILKFIDLNGIVEGILKDILKPALKKVVDSSSNKLDDALMMTIYPELEKYALDEAKKAIKKVKK